MSVSMHPFKQQLQETPNNLQGTRGKGKNAAANESMPTDTIRAAYTSR